jgi:hypothetical protein
MRKVVAVVLALLHNLLGAKWVVDRALAIKSNSKYLQSYKRHLNIIGKCCTRGITFSFPSLIKDGRVRNLSFHQRTTRV